MANINYYLDFTNGNDGNTGLMYSAYVVDSTSDTTHLTDATLSGMTINVGSFVWNITRSLGSLVSSFAGTTIVLATPITNMAAGDTYDLITPYLNISYFTQTGAARGYGDKCYIRANQTKTFAADLAADESGDYRGRISLIGCNATKGIDPWHDGSDIRPIINFNAGNYHFYWTRNYWSFKNLDIRNTSATDFGVLYCTNAREGIEIDNCIVRDAPAAGCALESAYQIGLRVRDSSFYNAGVPIRISGCTDALFDNCAVYGGANEGSYLIKTDDTKVMFKNCRLGTDNPVSYIFSTDNVSATVILQNCELSYNTGLINNSYAGLHIIREEDADQVYGAHKVTAEHGTSERDTSIVRPGGATSSAKIIPLTTRCSLYLPCSLTMHNNEPDFVIWCTAVTTTITVYVRGLNWASFPTASQLWLQAEYVTNDTSGSITRATVVSSQVLSDNTTWVGFAVTFTPHVASFVNLKLNLALYEDATTGIYVDIKPVVS